VGGVGVRPPPQPPNPQPPIPNPQFFVFIYNNYIIKLN